MTVALARNCHAEVVSHRMGVAYCVCPRAGWVPFPSTGHTNFPLVRWGRIGSVPIRSLLALVSALALLTACGGGGSAAVKPADALFAATPVVTPDAEGTSATLTVTTKLKVACRV